LNINELFGKYIELCKQNDPEGCGDLVVDLDDETCRELYLKLQDHPETKEKLVRSLWYNYRTQSMRW
jgi:hypothetical protein